MKKKIFGAIAVFVIAAVAAFNVSLNMNVNEMSQLSLANVEALANNEEAGITCSRSCSDGIGQCYHRNINCFYTGVQIHYCTC